MNYQEIMACRTKSTADMIKDCLHSIDSTQLLTDIFVITNDPLSKKLIKVYEAQLLLCTIDDKKFTETLHSCFTNTANYIKENNLYKQYFEFCNFIFKEIGTNGRTMLYVLTAYQNMLIQQYEYLSGSDKRICGVRQDNSLITIDEIYPNFDVPLYEYRKKHGEIVDANDFNLMKKLYKKQGYNLKNIKDFTDHSENERMIVNVLFQMSHFINEDYEDMISYNYYLPVDGAKELPRHWRENEFYIEKLKERDYLLPHNGVVAKFERAGNIKKILFKERYIDDNIVLLFKVTFANGKETSGFYIPTNSIFYDIWTVDKERDGKFTNIQNLILETYYHLTCDVMFERGKFAVMKIVDNLETPGSYYEQQVLVEFLTTTVTSDVGNKEKCSGYKKFNKEELTPYRREIDAFIRRLPVGSKASEEAIERARKRGIKVPEGKTFVSPHAKEVRRRVEI